MKKVTETPIDSSLNHKDIIVFLTIVYNDLTMIYERNVCIIDSVV